MAVTFKCPTSKEDLDDTNVGLWPDASTQVPIKGFEMEQEIGHVMAKSKLELTLFSDEATIVESITTGGLQIAVAIGDVEEFDLEESVAAKKNWSELWGCRSDEVSRN